MLSFRISGCNVRQGAVIFPLWYDDSETVLGAEMAEINESMVFVHPVHQLGEFSCALAIAHNVQTGRYEVSAHVQHVDDSQSGTVRWVPLEGTFASESEAEAAALARVQRIINERPDLLRDRS